ncbi:MAG: hypothetical protein J2P26_10355, partial [Nocardiopsaceae bacterium]|nr:hypothetical protein [Nocardiopsaceae bacterium]
VTDVFKQWMPGAPAPTSADAGVLFAHANDPGNPQVRQILASLPGPGAGDGTAAGSSEGSA